MRSPLLASFIVAALAILTACSEDDGGGSSGAARGCAADNRKDTYSAGLTKAAGGLQVRILEATPAPLAKGRNVLMLEIVDAGGQPVDGATVGVTPWMPDHAHGSAVRTVVTPSGSGKYEVKEIYLA